MAKVYYDKDADFNLLKGKKIAMLGYVEAFQLLFVLAVIITPLCLIMRSAKQSAEPGPVMHIE